MPLEVNINCPAAVAGDPVGTIKPPAPAALKLKIVVDMALNVWPEYVRSGAPVSAAPDPPEIATWPAVALSTLHVPPRAQDCPLTVVDGLVIEATTAPVVGEMVSVPSTFDTEVTAPPAPPPPRSPAFTAGVENKSTVAVPEDHAVEHRLNWVNPPTLAA